MMRKPKIIQCRWIRKGYCMNLFGTFWARDISWIDDDIINHERIHTLQMQELLYVPFYILYGIEWLLRLCQYHDCHKAYRNISFEREAYTHGNNPDYIKTRKHYSNLKYIRDGRNKG